MDSNNQQIGSHYKTSKTKRRCFMAMNWIFIISLVAFILIVSVSITTFFLHFHSNIIENYVKTKAEFVSRMLLLESVHTYILDKEYTLLEKHLKSITSDREILYAAILGLEGEMLSESNDYIINMPDLIEIKEIPLNGIRILPRNCGINNNLIYDVYMLIGQKNKQIGITRLIISPEDLEKTLSHIRNILLSLIFAIALVEIILCVLLLNFINKPTKELIDAARRLSEGDYDSNIQKISITEFGQLGQYLNKIASNIRQYKGCMINENNELKAIIDSMGSGLITVDKDWKIQMFNKSAERITGYKEKDVIGKTCQEILKSDKCQNNCPLEKSLKAGKPVVTEDFYIKTVEGKKIVINASTAPLKNEQGEIIGGIKVFKDLSEINELKKQLFQADKMAALGQMISGIAHEINSPLGVINSNMLSFLEYLETIKTIYAMYRTMSTELSQSNKWLSDAFSDIREYEEKNDIDHIIKDLDNLINENKEAYKRIKNIIKGLKSFIHIDMGKCEMADINLSLDMALDFIKFSHNVKIIKEYSQIPFTYCNAQQIEQVFTNILLNAFQALNGKGEIRIKTSHKDDKILVSIRDNGPGIPEDILLKIFDPYFTTKEVGVGTGLGLSISYKIVTQNGGRIWAESEFGKWTVFFIEIPVKSPPSISKIWRDD